MVQPLNALAPGKESERDVTQRYIVQNWRVTSSQRPFGVGSPSLMAQHVRVFWGAAARRVETASDRSEARLKTAVLLGRLLKLGQLTSDSLWASLPGRAERHFPPRRSPPNTQRDLR